MKKIVPLIILGIAAAATACVSYASWNNKPDYLQAAETRVKSYLTSDYGTVTCTSSKKDNDRWTLECLSRPRGKTFAYTVLPAEKAPYDMSRSFYLEAVNNNARQSADQGLMRYLQINTAVPTS